MYVCTMYYACMYVCMYVFIPRTKCEKADLVPSVNPPTSLLSICNRLRVRVSCAAEKSSEREGERGEERISE